MATIDLKEKLTNESGRMDQMGRAFAIALPVVLDQFFTFTQNGETLSRVTANMILVGGAGSLALEMAFTLNNIPVISFIPAVFPGQEIRGLIKRVLSVSALGNTTATNLTWTSGQ
jgi:hypothetical protein